jgi:hypothetical protein
MNANRFALLCVLTAKVFYEGFFIQDRPAGCADMSSQDPYEVTMRARAYLIHNDVIGLNCHIFL